MLRPGGASGEGDEALEFYAKHTAQIEVTTHNRCHTAEHQKTSSSSRKLNVRKETVTKYTSREPTEAEVFALWR